MGRRAHFERGASEWPRILGRTMVLRRHARVHNVPFGPYWSDIHEEVFAMKYIVQTEINPSAGSELEDNTQVLQSLIEKWQTHKPIGLYFSLTRRTITVILEADSEDAFFEVLHATWRATRSYPDVYPVADVGEFPRLLRRVGLGL
jgi:hypothetical protein